MPPFDLLMWRQNNETHAKHRCPIFNVPGVGPRSLAPDTLHALNLGVDKAYCQAVLWSLIDDNAYGVPATTVEVRVELSVKCIRRDLFAWYAYQKKTRPGHVIHELTDFTPAMLGSSTDRALSTKAAETATLVEFCAEVVRAHANALGPVGVALAELDDALRGVRDLCKAAGPVLTVAEAQHLIDLAKRAASLREPAGIDFTPKWHIMLHLVCDAYWRGNPRAYATFADEGINGFLAQLAACCHSLTWHKSVLANFRLAITRGPVGRKRR